MKHVFIPFTVESNSLEDAKSIIKKFVRTVQQKEPDTLMYHSFQQSDEPTNFVHIMTFKNEEAMELHKYTEHCKEFVDRLYPLCAILPKASMYYEII